jgi:hypothetical protein
MRLIPCQHSSSTEAAEPSKAYHLSATTAPAACIVHHAPRGQGGAFLSFGIGAGRAIDLRVPAGVMVCDLDAMQHRIFLGPFWITVTDQQRLHLELSMDLLHSERYLCPQETNLCCGSVEVDRSC